MSELREDLLTGARVIVAPGRSVRPDTFRTDAPELPSSVPACPFCAGNEHETPPEVARRGAGDPETPGWRVRVVPNKYPLVGVRRRWRARSRRAVARARSLVRRSRRRGRGRGVRSPPRSHRPAPRRRAHARARVHQSRQSRPARRSSIPHAQVIALDFVPPFVDAMLDRFAAAHRDLVHDALDEARAENLMIADGDAACWCPPASELPYAARCALPFGRQRFDIAADGELRAVAVAPARLPGAAAGRPRRRSLQRDDQHRARRRRPPLPLVDRHPPAADGAGRLRARDRSGRVHRRTRSRRGRDPRAA